MIVALQQADADVITVGTFDAKKPVTLKGKVTKVDWMNPHIYIHIDAVDAGATPAPGIARAATPTVSAATVGSRRP